MTELHPHAAETPLYLSRTLAQRPARSTQTRLFALLTIAATLASAPSINAQQPRADSDWSRVQALPPGVTVDVKTKTQHLHCKISSVIGDAITCTSKSAALATVLQRGEIRTVRIDRRGRSALIGAGVGGGGLGIAAFAATTNHGDSFFGPNFLRGPATGLGILAGGLIGGGIGALTDFSHTTLYRAP